MNEGRDEKKRAHLGVALLTGAAGAATEFVAAGIGMPTDVALATSFGVVSGLCFLAFRIFSGGSVSEWPVEQLINSSTAAALEPQPGLSPAEASDKPAPSFAVQAPVFERLFERAAQSNASVTEETEAAAQDILSQLQRVDQSISRLLLYLQEANGRMLEIVARTEKGINDNRQVIAQYLDRRGGDVADSRSRLGEIEDFAKSLAATAESIRTIAQQSRMLSLNATIEASRAGEFGAGFTVVANEVKTLAKLSDSSAKEIGIGIGSLRKSIHESIVVLVETRLSNEKSELGDISSALGHLTEQTDQLVAFERDVLGKVRSESECIGDAILQLTGSIQFQDITRQRLEHLSKIFNLAQRHMQDVSATNGADAAACLPCVDGLASAVEDEGPSRPRREIAGAMIELF
jgi:methyl-accepting chemotaxis protein